MKKALFLLAILPALNLFSADDIAYRGGEGIGENRSFDNRGSDARGVDNRGGYDRSRENQYGGYRNSNDRGYDRGAYNGYNRGNVNAYGGYVGPEYGGNVVAPEVSPYADPYYQYNQNQYPQ